MYAVAAIANKFIEFACSEAAMLTNMQLQKLPFIANGWSLAIFDAPLIADQAQVWPYGPVYPSLYQALSRYGSGPVTEPIHENDDNIFEDDRGSIVVAVFSPQEEQLLRTVWKAYKSYSGLKLSALTHLDDAPWSITKKFSGLHSVIPDSVTKNYYKRMLTTE